MATIYSTPRDDMMPADALANVHSALHRQGRFTDDRAASLATAYAIAERAHAGQLRKSGQPYITHPVQVAEIVAGWDLPFAALPAALLHDVADPTCSTAIPLESLRAIVSNDVLTILCVQHELKARHDPFTLISGPVPTSRTTALTSEDLTACAVIVRIADRLHNARTWQYVEPDRARARAQETLDLIAPLAAAVALPAARDELLQLSLSTLRRTRPRRRRTATERHRSHRSEHMTQSLLHRAVDRLPERLRSRYAEEWAADLATLTSSRERIKFAAGLQYSARRLSSEAP